MAYVNSQQDLEIFSEIQVMPVKLQNCSFTGITHISDKDFQMLIAVTEPEI